MNTIKNGILPSSSLANKANYIEENNNNSLKTNNDYEHIKPFGRFGFSSEFGKIGYYLKNNSSYDKMTDFIVVFDKQVMREFQNQTTSIFEGKIILSDGTERKFSKLKADHFSNFTELKKFLMNLCGTKINISCKNMDLIDAIITTNREVAELKAVEHGYTKDLKEYNTKTMTINIDGIEKRNNPILNEYNSDKNNLDFDIADIEEVEEIKLDIINDFISLDDPLRTVTALSFTLMPIILPFLEKSIQKKPFLMLKGPSGCGKTTLAELGQKFYGDFPTLLSWTSTATVIEVIGNAFKDSVFVVDDFKSQNFRNSGDLNRVSMVLQNYSDNTSRSRSNSSLGIQSSKTINGVLVISAEDLVVSEASTIARGIILDMENKIPNFEAIKKAKESAKRFKKLTPYFIQFVMENASKYDLNNSYNTSLKQLNQYAEENDLKGNNIPRLLENFSLLLTSAGIILHFLLKNVSKEISHNIYQEYTSNFVILLKGNYNRIQNFNPERKFIDNLWQLIDEGTLIIHDINGIPNYYEQKTVGYYEKDISGELLKLSINVSKAYKMINNYLKDEGGIGTGFDSLNTRLFQMGYIHSTNKNAAVHFTKRYDKDRKQRGTKWLGPIPEDLNI